MSVLAPPSSMISICGKRVALRAGGQTCAKPPLMRVRCAVNKDQTKKTVLGLGALAGSAVAQANVALAAELSAPLRTFVDAVDSTASLVEQLGKKGSDAAEVAAPYVERAGKALAPIGETTSKLFERNVAPLASDVVSSASKAASSALTGLGSSLKEQGLPLDAVEGAYKTVSMEGPKAYTAAKPVLEGVVEFLVKSDPVTLAEYAVVLYVVYLARDLVLNFIGTQIRGYAGDLSPPQALNTLMKEGSAVLVDLRTLEEVNAKGQVDLSKKQQKQLVICERTTLPGGQYANQFDAEIQVTAVKVASLKSVNKGKIAILLDQNGKQAKRIAKELGSKGYGKVFVVEGGFQGWTAAQLKTKASFSAKADAVMFSRPKLPSVPAPRRPTPAVDVMVNNPTPRARSPAPPSLRRMGNKLNTVSGSVVDVKALPPPRGN